MATTSTRGTKGTKGKRRNTELQMKLFHPDNARDFLVFRTSRRQFHVFQEVEAKDAAKRIDPSLTGHSNKIWSELWKRTG